MNMKKGGRELLSAAAESFDIPRSLVPGQTVLEITGDREILAQSHGGIVDYSDLEVKFASGGGIVRVAGENLRIRSMTREHLRITGRIISVEFLTAHD